MNELLKVENLLYRYPHADSPALRNISFSVAPGTYLAVLGANGSGKSTLARCIAGLTVPEAGSVSFNIGSEKVPSALVFQSPGDQLIAETVELDIAFGPENLGLTDNLMRDRVESALRVFEMSEIRDGQTDALSSGQKQKLALAGIYALSPALLMLDEATSMLAPRARESVLDFLDRHHRDGFSILHITHDLDEAARASRVLVLDRGELVFDGTSSELRSLPVCTLVAWGLHAGEEDRVFAGRGSADRSSATSADTSPAVSLDSVFSCRDAGCGPLRDFSLMVKPGSVVAVTGESGSGKTTLMELLSGLRLPESGTVTIDPSAVSALAVQESEASLFAEFVADDVAFGPMNAGLSGRALVERVSAAMNLVGLPYAQFRDRRTFTLSGGERRKAALAGILAMDSAVVLLDEPSSALDVRSRAHLSGIIQSLREAGKTVVFTTNRETETLIADQVVRLPLPDGRPVERKAAKAQTADQKTLAKLRRGTENLTRSTGTILHRLSPLSRYIVTICCLAAALSLRGPLFLGGLILIELALAAAVRYPMRRLLVSFLRILPWFIFLGLIQYFIFPAAPHILYFIARFAALLIPLSIFTSVTPRTAVMHGMEDLLSPLRILRVPVRDVSLLVAVVFRFIALLYEEALRIVTARIIRGATRAGRARGLGRIREAASLFVPLVLRTLLRAERLSQAITARYYGAAAHSRYAEQKNSPLGTVVTIGIVLATAALIWLSHQYYWSF